MRYMEYTVFTDIGRLDSLIGDLTAAGLGGLIINDPREAAVFEDEPHGFGWDYVDESVLSELAGRPSVRFYLPEGEALSKEVSSLLLGFEIERKPADDEDWLHQWEAYYVPTRLSERVVAKPVWKDYAPQEGDIVVDIDPGMAFGTGSSPTSYLTVRLMDRWLKPCALAYDVGCGTGILSVIAVKLGAEHVDAFELDPEAVACTPVNAALNGCADRISVRQNDLLSGIQKQADDILANLTAELVTRLLPDAARCLKQGGLLFASGIIDDKEKTCCAAIEAAGFTILDIVRDDGWSAVCARKD